MLLKKNRADKKDVEKLFKACPPSGREGRFLNSLNLTFKFINTKTHLPPRISFIVSKKIAKLAVKRNSLRRIGYSLLKKSLPNIPAGTIGVFVFKKYQDDVLILENEIKEIIHKLN